MSGWCVFMHGRAWREDTGNHWSEVEGGPIRSLWLERDGRIYRLPDGKSGYFQSKTASAPIGGGEAQIVSRNIGWVEGGARITLRVSEKDGSVVVEAAKA